MIKSKRQHLQELQSIFISAADWTEVSRLQYEIDALPAEPKALWPSTVLVLWRLVFDDICKLGKEIDELYEHFA